MGRDLMRRQVMFTGANATEKENQSLFLLGEDTHKGTGMSRNSFSLHRPTGVTLF